mgnify:CR=1 FL=1
MEAKKLIKQAEEEVKEQFKVADEICEFNSEKVLKAFQENNVTETDFGMTTGYGYDDLGREKIEKIYADIFKAEDALVRVQFISGTHALTVTLFGLLRPGDTMLSINGKPYDTLDEVIGLKENSSSLKAFGINYEQVDLINDDFDYEQIEEKLKAKKYKLIEIQRSKGYSTRKSISIDKVEKAIQTIRKIDKDVIIMIDNCYCEFVGKKEPTEVGADIVVGSLIKNLGGGIAPNGGYVVGKKELIELVAQRLTVPGEGKEVGPTLGINRNFLQGIFMAPSVVNASVKTEILTAKVMENLGYKVEPKYNEERVDIVQNIEFGTREGLIKYCQGVQAGSPVDSNSTPVPCQTPGYIDEIIMAAGAFTQGSSIEFSCDGPLRPPFIAYQQGALTYEYGKLGVTRAVENFLK